MTDYDDRNANVFSTGPVDIDTDVPTSLGYLWVPASAKTPVLVSSIELKPIRDAEAPPLHRRFYARVSRVLAEAPEPLPRSESSVGDGDGITWFGPRACVIRSAPRGAPERASGHADHNPGLGDLPPSQRYRPSPDFAFDLEFLVNFAATTGFFRFPVVRFVEPGAGLDISLHRLTPYSSAERARFSARFHWFWTAAVV